MGTKFIKGKWFVKDTSVYDEYGLIAFTANRYDIDQIEVRTKGESWITMRKRTEPERKKANHERKANAKLIAAAPELLKSCIDLLADLRQILINDCLGQDQDEDTSVRYAESFDLIKKATMVIKKATE